MILIVDDKPENIYSLRTLLEMNNFQVDTAFSGEDALKKVLKNNYALFILDVQMPGMDGFEVAEAISGHSKAKNTPIIFLSALNTEKRFITKGYNSGGIDYVVKPFDPDILLMKVKTLYRLYEQTRRLNETQDALREEIEVRKHAQNEQWKKTQELQSILESLPQIAFTATAAGKIEYVNKHWYQYSDSKDKFPITHPADVSIADTWDNAVKQHEPLSIELRIKGLSDDEYKYHLLKVTPIVQDDAIVKWVGTFTDIHVQRSATEVLEQRVEERTRELMESNKELERSNHDLQQFASVASHDLKEPLRKIQIFSSIVRDRYGEDTDSGAMQYVDRIIDSSSRMNKLINDLLTYSRLSVASLFRLVSLNEIVNEIIIDLEIIITEKQAAINVAALPDIEVIPGQIRQIFQNIISNALKFTKAGVPPVISITADIIGRKAIDGAIDPHGNYCRISIGDNGIGFNEVYLDKIFTIFQRLNMQEEYEGTGIGLAIAKKIVDKHNGIITAKSEEGKGATFIIVLPLKQHDVHSAPLKD